MRPNWKAVLCTNLKTCNNNFNAGGARIQFVRTGVEVIKKTQSVLHFNSLTEDPIQT